MYTLTEFLEHCSKARNEQVQWHDALKHFKNDRERDAYITAFTQGMVQARELIERHGGYKFK